MKASILFMLFSYTSFAQDSITPGTNPLAHVMPAPVSKVESDYYKSELNHIEPLYPRKDTAFQSEYSQNVKDYQHEQEHPSPLESFKDDKVKFNDYSKPAVATTSHTTQEYTDNGIIGKIDGGILSLFAVFLTFMSIKSPHSRRVKNVNNGNKFY